MKHPLTPQLLDDLCHDLRGPLGAIGTWVPVLKSERADGETRLRAVSAMGGDVRVMGALIDQVSALSEVFSGSARITLAPIDAVPLARSACAAASENGPELLLREDEDSLLVLADAVRLRQVVELLASSVFNTAPGGSRALTVSRRERTAELRFETTGTPRTLSITLARALAEVQGGALEESRVDGTTVLRVHLPLAP